MARKTHKNQDPEELEEFKQNIVAKLNEFAVAPNQRVYIWIQDEHRYGLITTIRRCWTLRGHRVKVPFAMKYQWSYLYGAVEMTTGKTVFIYTPTVSLSCGEIFLQQITQTDPDGIHIVIRDRAGFHQKPQSSDIPEQIRLLPLPPYCPELNPVEKLWEKVKDHVSNKVFETLEDIEAQISTVLSPFWSSAQRVFDWLGDNWLTQGVATFISQRKAALTSV